MCLIYVSLGYTPDDNYLIDCGGSSNKTVGGRLFVSESFYPNILSTPQNISVQISSKNAIPNAYASDLYGTARIFRETSQYKFPIKKHGRHWIRLHFSPFVSQSFNMSLARFSVTAQDFTLLKEYQIGNGSAVKEYNLDVTSDQLVLTFTPAGDSFAFVNALEVISLPDELIPEKANTDDMPNNFQVLSKQALETVARVNMGNVIVSPQNDTLWRLWVSDDSFLLHNNLAKYVSNISAVKFTDGGPSEIIAPAVVYGTATRLNSESDPHTNANVTWNFPVNPGFQYLVRFHFCDIISNSPGKLFFKAYINSKLVRDFDFSAVTSNILGAPYYMDVITRVSDKKPLSVRVGPASNDGTIYPNGILNGLEIMKINNARNSLDAFDSEMHTSSSKAKTFRIVSLSVGVPIVACLALALVLLCRRRKKLADAEHSNEEEGGQGYDHTAGAASKYSYGPSLFSVSKIGYRLPFVAIQEATSNFSESMVIGVGGFGKVYKGVFKDGTKVAVKRGAPQSHQGLTEFRTEIEMLSQFRHRHLVSLIGYCDEHNEMIIIYEYMENGTLKEHLYGSENPSLSWRQRLEICIGAARGLHYLHTGSTRAIIHRDVKSANILLDENFMAKVADFGLSKTGPEIDQTHVSTAVKGSFGYLDPEYLTRQQLTEKSDVYSFGVVMFEVLCGRPVIDPSLPRERVNLIELAMKFQKRGQLEEIIDPCLSGQVNPNSLKKFGEIAEKCLAENGISRPSMGNVLWSLEGALQLQANEERATVNEGITSRNQSFNNSQATVPNADISYGSVGDMSTVSMSKVFAQMVRQDMR